MASSQVKHLPDGRVTPTGETQHGVHAGNRQPGITPPAGPTVEQERVAARAYELYCARGCEDGRDVEDWLEAELQLRNDTSGGAAEGSPE